MTMGTASTMASMVEALGWRCRTTRRFPRWIRAATFLAHIAGRRIVEMVREDLRSRSSLPARRSKMPFA